MSGRTGPDWRRSVLVVVVALALVGSLFVANVTAVTSTNTTESEDTNIIEGDISDTNLNAVADAEDARFTIEYVGGSGDKSDDVVLVDSMPVSDFDTLGDPIGDAGFIDNGEGSIDEFFIELPNYGEGTEFKFTVELLGYQTYSGITNPLNPGDVDDENIFLEESPGQTSEYRLDVTVGTDQKREQLPAGNSTAVTVLVERKNATEQTSAFEPAAGVNVTLDRRALPYEPPVDDIGTLVNTTVTTDAGGIATTTFEAEPSLTERGVLNLTAELTEPTDEGNTFPTTDGQQATVVVYPVADIVGEVSILQSEPVAGAAVTLYERTDFGYEQIESTIADENGQYVFTDLKTPSDYRINATGLNRTGSVTIDDLSPGTHNKDIVVTETADTATITGDVVNTTDDAIPNATVKLYVEGADTPLAATVTDWSGRYTVPEVVTGQSYQLNATVDGSTGVTEVQNLAAGTTTADIVVPNVAPGPSLRDYTDGDNVVRIGGLRDAIADWRTGTIEIDLLRAVIEAWRSGTPVE